MLCVLIFYPDTITFMVISIHFLHTFHFGKCGNPTTLVVWSFKIGNQFWFWLQLWIDFLLSKMQTIYSVSAVQWPYIKNERNVRTNCQMIKTAPQGSNNIGVASITFNSEILRWVSPPQYLLYLIYHHWFCLSVEPPLLYPEELLQPCRAV